MPETAKSLEAGLASRGHTQGGAGEQGGRTAIEARSPLRWQPLMEMGLKLGALTWVTTSFLSWLLLNAYLGAIGQRGIPLDLAGTWAALVLMGAILTLAVAAMGSVFIVGEQMMRPLHPDGPVPQSTRVTFFVAATAALVALLLLEEVTGRTMVGLFAALPAGLAAGVGVRRWFLGKAEAQERGKVVGFLGAWIVVATLLFLLVAAEFGIVLRLQLEEKTPFLLALGLSLIQLGLCTFLSSAWAISVTLVSIAWLTTAVSPGIYAIVLIALQATNLGGGLPSEALLTKEAATICNLGTAQRPVIYRERNGCTKAAALTRLRKVVAADTAMGKAAVLAGWREEGSSGRAGAVKTTTPVR